MDCVLDSVLSGLDQALVEFIMLCSDLCSLFSFAKSERRVLRLRE